MKVLAAMSGGVDSAVAAARAVDAGHEVVGVHLALSRMPGTLRTGSRGCCTVEDSMDAQRAANKIGIPFYVWDFSERFKQEVVDDFISEYQAGRTPNPCMRCNERIKFAALLEKALALGFDALCTGHYASIETDSKGNLELHRSLAMAKDQSYVLGVLDKQQLQHSLFPLGKAANKEDIRAEAKARELSVAQKPDSYDICFIPEVTPEVGSRTRLKEPRAPLLISRETNWQPTMELLASRLVSARDSTSVSLPPMESLVMCFRLGPKTMWWLWALTRRYLFQSSVAQSTPGAARHLRTQLIGSRPRFKLELMDFRTHVGSS